MRPDFAGVKGATTSPRACTQHPRKMQVFIPREGKQVISGESPGWTSRAHTLQGCQECSSIYVTPWPEVLNFAVEAAVSRHPDVCPSSFRTPTAPSLPHLVP